MKDLYHSFFLLGGWGRVCVCVWGGGVADAVMPREGLPSRVQPRRQKHRLINEFGKVLVYGLHDV